MFLCAAVWLVPVHNVEGLYIRPDLVNVPIDRLVENLEALAKKNPKDAQVRLNLARAHAMAYAQKTDTAQVWRDKEAQGVWFGYEPKHVPFTVKPTDDPKQLAAAKQHLQRAIEWYQETVKLAPGNLTAKLGLAWTLQQAGQKDKAIAAFREVIEEAWKKEKDMQRAPLGWHSVTAEAATYLIPLLDAQKDKEEIETLRERIKKMQMVPRPVTPVAIPLRDGLTASDLINPGGRVRFDADGTGLKQTWTWITPDAGWLVYDPHNTRNITSALQMFGSVTFWMFWDNGYQAMAALDDNFDGQLTGKELDGLALWHDGNSNGVCEPGEVKPLADWGIVALSCRCEIDTHHPDQLAFSPVGVRFRDGTTRATYDLVLHRR
jgi:tetratricopeptide (TPR) repeat protein